METLDLEEGSDRYDDFPAQMLFRVRELDAEDMCVFSRRPIGDAVYFDDTMPGYQRWEMAKAEKREAVVALFDIRLSDVVISPKPETHIGWYDENEFVEATVVRCNEGISFAQEVMLDDNGDPLSATNTLWTGNDAAIEEFLADKLPGARIDHSDDLLDEAERIMQRISDAPPALRRVGIAFLALMALEQAMISVPAGVSFGGARPLRRKLPKKSPPVPHTLKNAVGSIRPATKHHRLPIRQPRPQSGAKWGKRAQS